MDNCSGYDDVQEYPSDNDNSGDNYMNYLLYKKNKRREKVARKRYYDDDCAQDDNDSHFYDGQ